MENAKFQTKRKGNLQTAQIVLEAALRAVPRIHHRAAQIPLTATAAVTLRAAAMVAAVAPNLAAIVKLSYKGIFSKMHIPIQLSILFIFLLVPFFLMSSLAFHVYNFLNFLKFFLIRR